VGPANTWIQDAEQQADGCNDCHPPQEVTLEPFSQPRADGFQTLKILKWTS
jgi:hypothetical protein